MDLDVAELVGVELLHDQRRVLLDALKDLGELVCRGRQSEDLTTQEKFRSIQMTGSEQTRHYIASTVMTQDSILRVHLNTCGLVCKFPKLGTIP
jgi:hypothetical protein